MSPIVLVLLAVAFVVFGVTQLWSSRKKTAPVKAPQTPTEKPWEYPEPSPDLSFDLEKTGPPKFRAFRYSYKRHTIETRKLDKDSWVMLDNEWPLYYDLKVKRLADRGEKIVKTLPEARFAARELCQDLSEFLSRRYPQVYTIERSTKDKEGWYGLGSVTKISMPPFGASFDLTKEDPLTVAGLLQPTDVNILLENNDGSYRLAAMMLGIGGGQRLKDKLGRNFDDLHFGGHVPHYKEQLQRPLGRYLSKLKVEVPVHRNTTAISIHDAYHWPTLTMGPEDDWDPVQRGPGVGTPSYGVWQPPEPVTSVDQLWFRQERQVLRRLPKSGAIVWMVHTYVEPLTEVAQEPGVPGRMASLVRSWDDVMASHKGRHLYEKVLLPYLDDLHRKQVESGVCEDGELPSNFPF